MSRSPNRYGPPGPALVGIPFAGPYADFGVLQTFGMVGSIIFVLPMASMLPDAWGDALQIGVGLFAGVLLSIACAHPALAAGAFTGAVFHLFEQTKDARVLIYPTFYGACLDVSGLRATTPWGLAAVHFRGRWILPFRRHSVEVALGVPLRLRLYANARGVWIADARAEPLREAIAAALAELASASARSVHLAVSGSEVRLGLHGFRHSRKSWLAIDRALQSIMAALLDGDGRAQGYRDEATDADRLETIRDRERRTRVLEAEEPPVAWRRAFWRERRWRKEDQLDVARAAIAPRQANP